tara:strand:+ start:362 stop:1330 length:969 start_codon:yes stop_codon:yes gene_type:complete
MRHRHRILRKSASIRSLVRETKLQPDDFILPMFIVEGEGLEEEISSLPNYFRRSLDLTILEVEKIWSLGIKSVLLFVKCEDNLKDNEGKESLNPDGLMQKSIKAIKAAVPQICVMTDVALDPYSIHGHDGIVEEGQIINDKTVDVLAQMALSHARAGADIIAPSDMMDGRIRAIREKLELNSFINTGILSYSAKYASCFYGPFRDALDSSPGFGDKKSYQMDPANRLEAIKEVALDIKEGADIVMVKPALSYLDIIREVKNKFQNPVAAYQVSGEYSMIKAAAQNGWIDEESAIMEATTSIKRAGADLIASYFTKDIVNLIN